MRKRKRSSLPAISAEQARQALQVLVEEGRVAGREVADALRRREKTIRELKSRLAALGAEASSAVGRIVRKARKAGAARARRAKPRKAITRAQRIARQAQGQYMAAIRSLSKDSKEKIRAIRKSSGVKAAISAAKKLAS